MKLVIIGGFPRAGTRNFADIMNFHDEFIIQGEIHTNVLRAISELFQAADISHFGKRTERAYLNRRAAAALEIYRLMSKTNSDPIEFDFSANFLGFKQPFIERQHKCLAAIFSRDHKECVFFFCLRNIFDNFLSLHSAFNYTTDKYARALRQSISALKEMEQSSFFRVHPLWLDDYIETKRKADWLRLRVFEPVGICPSDEWLEECLGKTTNRNKTPPSQRKNDLSDKMRSDLIGNKDLVKGIRWLEGRFEAELLGKLL